MPLQRHDLVAARGERGDRRPPEQARASGDEHPHQTRLGAGPPARTAPAQRPSRVRSIFELWRRSTGSVGTVSTAATACGASASRTAPSTAGGGEPCLALVLDDDDDLLRSPAGPTPVTAQRNPVAALDGDLERHRGHRAVGGRDDVRHPALDPEAPFGVEMTDVAGAMPLDALLVDRARPVGRGPEAVVAERLPRRADDDLPALAVAAGERLDPEPATPASG